MILNLKLRIALPALVALLSVAKPALAGPWTKDLGGVYAKLGEGFFVASSYVDASGRVVKGTKYFGATTSVYAEAGVYKGLHLQVYLPYIAAQNRFNDGSTFLNASGGDGIFAVQYSPPLKLPFVWALRFDIKVPFYDVGGIKGPLAMLFPAPGDGQLDFTWWLSAGHGLKKIPFYFFVEAGYRHRTEVYIGKGDTRKFADGFAFATQVGYTIKKRVLVALNFSGIVPFKEDDYTKLYLTLGPSVYVPVWKGLAAEAFFDPVIYARNSANGFGFGLGFSYKR